MGNLDSRQLAEVESEVHACTGIAYGTKAIVLGITRKVNFLNHCPDLRVNIGTKTFVRVIKVPL
jgi:hypothetical protein